MKACVHVEGWNGHGSEYESNIMCLYHAALDCPLFVARASERGVLIKNIFFS